MSLPAMSLLETRVIGVLVEKQHTVPDAYPLTLNALVAGCNQKTSRDPLLEASDAEVQSALDRLKSRSMVIETSGGRAMRYAQNVGKVLGVPPQSVALLATLFLRGPQTAGELRIHSERLHRFGDILAVEGFLNELAERREGALVRELPRAAGARETRWMHLLSGDTAPAAAMVLEASSRTAEDNAVLAARVERLEAEVRALRDRLDALGHAATASES
jgi:hypothetical protein